MPAAGGDSVGARAEGPKPDSAGQEGGQEPLPAACSVKTPPAAPPRSLSFLVQKRGLHCPVGSGWARGGCPGRITATQTGAGCVMVRALHPPAIPITAHTPWAAALLTQNRPRPGGSQPCQSPPRPGQPPARFRVRGLCRPIQHISTHLEGAAMGEGKVPPQREALLTVCCLLGAEWGTQRQQEGHLEPWGRGSVQSRNLQGARPGQCQATGASPREGVGAQGEEEVSRPRAARRVRGGNPRRGAPPLLSHPQRLDLRKEKHCRAAVFRKQGSGSLQGLGPAAVGALARLLLSRTPPTTPEQAPGLGPPHRRGRRSVTSCGAAGPTACLAWSLSASPAHQPGYQTFDISRSMPRFPHLQSEAMMWTLRACGRSEGG